MFKHKLLALFVSVLNLVIVLLLIGFVIENRFVQILLGVYAIIFSSIVSFLSRSRPEA